MHRQAAGLIEWLERGSGAFWVHGKPGSGKSTLIKFIVEHPRTFSLLRRWAGGREPMMMSHFFWLPGPTIKNSLQGLLRSLLHQTLSHHHPSSGDSRCADVVASVCARRWRSRSPAEAWSVSELWETFRGAVSGRADPICIFIDGLDEHQPDSQHAQYSQQKELLQELLRLTSYPNVKLVLSSRPWQVFRLALGSLPTLVMESLNHRAIANFVRRRLENADSEVDWSEVCWRCINFSKNRGRVGCTNKHGEPHALIRHVVSKADGVFLWASLVAESLCEQLSSGDSTSDLDEQVQDLPSELEQYYHSMVDDRLNETWKTETAMALHLAMHNIQGIVPYWLLS